MLQSWPKLCGTSLQNALTRPSISFSHGNKRSLGQILPSSPSPHAMLFVRKGLPTSRPTLHRGERGSERILQQFGKKALCPTHFGQDCQYHALSLQTPITQSVWKCTVSKFVWVKFVHVLHTSLTSRLWKNSFVAIYQRFRGQQT